MKKLILLFSCCMLLNTLNTTAQIGYLLDSTKFTLTVSDSLTHFMGNAFYSGDTATVIIDTATSHLWQIGNTYKSVFSSDTIASRGIMTDTLNAYPANANAWFTIKIFNPPPNPTIGIWHEYQMDSAHAGGVIEFSIDSGITWLNIDSCDNIQSQSLYAITDTLYSGQPAFTGTSNGQQHSSFQFANCFLIKSTQATSCYFAPNVSTLFIRFRFISDSTIDTLSGWKIDSIEISTPGCFGGVPIVKKNQLIIYPNPAYDGVFHFPVLDKEQDYTIDVFNSIGDKIITIPYREDINISNFPKGLYFYKVTGNNEYYSGKLLYD